MRKKDTLYHNHDLSSCSVSVVDHYNYLVATGKPVGLVINFGEKKVEIKRKIKDLEKYTINAI
ncbi:MAG: hypothetical protein JETT_0290 [Candidatus Jettenia ecosi]|uniref:GxxExxY protein n=1 Tax=Candidatus Jettenia ecosi TaxID=2494326 RepID=A0A533QFR3_9BACT|nr:MAG: hypothetical protein JETT_0290 [Candidatus Jettenia ecosi]